MFDDQQNKTDITFDPKRSKSFDPASRDLVIQDNQNKRVVIAVVLALFVLFSIIGVIIYIRSNARSGTKPVAVVGKPGDVQNATTSTSTLPIQSLPENLKQEQNDKLQAEKLGFADFYKLSFVKTENKTSQLQLPMSIKSDVANYYDFTRSVNLDEHIENLNADGFAVISNQFDEKPKDFFDAYDVLMNKGLPVYVTSDFLLNYYQNQLKLVYDDILTTKFYRDMWDINSAFYELANSRYKSTRSILGDVNDPVMEGQRLEAAYFVVALKLLSARSNQITRSSTVTPGKFSESEARLYNFITPSYLAADVDREVQSILYANRVAKSPVLLTNTDYTQYANDKKNTSEKMNNFNLATHWFRAQFPLYEKSDKCPDCELDDVDWLRSFITANYIASDFASNQEFKNQWAKIYKVMAYFTGLATDLSYTHYDEVISQKFGSKVDISFIYGTSTSITDKIDIARFVRDEIANKFTFSEFYGGISRESDANNAKLGMRMLQTAYWPDGYIFKQLTGSKVGAYIGPYKNKTDSLKRYNSTYCIVKSGIERCKPTAYDIVNLFSPVVESDYFVENTAYEEYASRSSEVASSFSQFDLAVWHSNVYWNTVDIWNQSIYKFEDLNSPVNQTSPAWKRRQNNTLLGSWVNLRVPAEEINVRPGVVAGSLVFANAIEVYVEPNERLMADLAANAKMVLGLLKNLKIVGEADYANKQLMYLTDNMTRMHSIVIKELVGEGLSDLDTTDVVDFLRKKVGNPAKSKSFLVTDGQKKGPTAAINDIKFLVQVYAKDGKNKLVIGPVYNFTESK